MSGNECIVKNIIKTSFLKAFYKFVLTCKCLTRLRCLMYWVRFKWLLSTCIHIWLHIFIWIFCVVITQLSLWTIHYLEWHSFSINDITIYVYSMRKTNLVNQCYGNRVILSIYVPFDCYNYNGHFGLMV